MPSASSLIDLRTTASGPFSGEPSHEPKPSTIQCRFVITKVMKSRLAETPRRMTGAAWKFKRERWTRFPLPQQETLRLFMSKLRQAVMLQLRSPDIVARQELY